MVSADNLRALLNVAQVVADPDGPVAPIAIHLGSFLSQRPRNALRGRKPQCRTALMTLHVVTASPTALWAFPA